MIVMYIGKIDGYEVMCQLWFLPYTEACVSSILRGAGSADRRRRYSSMHLSPTYNTQHSSQLDGLSLSSYNGSHSNYLTNHDNISPNKSLSGSERRSRSRSPRQSRLKSRYNSLKINHSKSKKKSRYRSRYNEICSKSSHSRSLKSSRYRSSKSSRYRSSRKP